MAPDRKQTELNEIGWWSNWARLRWHGDGYLLSSDALPEPFFNRGGSLTCRAVTGASAWAEASFFRRGVSSTFLVFDDCRGRDALANSGYREVDSMRVLLSKGRIEERRRTGSDVTHSHSPRGWASAYLDAFYGSRDLIGVVSPIASKLSRAKGITLLESKVKGETAGAMALFRTPGLVGVYCLGTSPKHRRQGVATGLLNEARRVADEEGRSLILQTLESDGAGEFYRRRGFAKLYSKYIMERRLNPNQERRK